MNSGRHVDVFGGDVFGDFCPRKHGVAQPRHVILHATGRSSGNIQGGRDAWLQESAGCDEAWSIMEHHGPWIHGR